MYTTVCGVDKKHLEQLALVWPTWAKHKPSLLEHPMIVFYDKSQVDSAEIREIVDHPRLSIYSWPMGFVQYTGTAQSKWKNPQRYKMLAGFVYVPAMYVRTQYWLKLDTDVVAVGHNHWIDENWFADNPAIIAHRWSFTKPPQQMKQLDDWAAYNEPVLPRLTGNPPLNLHPVDGASRLGHKRIISFCGLFNTKFTKDVARMCGTTCGGYKLPAPSQDGVMWYVAKRMGKEIKRVDMKSRGWQHWSTMKNVKNAVLESLSE